MQFQDDANFVGVAWTGSDDSFQDFIDRHGLTFPQISDDPGDVFDRFGISYQPALVVVNTDGSTELVAGAVDEELLAPDHLRSELNHTPRAWIPRFHLHTTVTPNGRIAPTLGPCALPSPDQPASSARP